MQSGTRYPMLLDIATRAVSGPLDIRGDHSDVYFALNTGWLIFMARDPQAVYDLNLIALRVAERADVRLPAIVAFDGFFTSHQKRRVSIFEDDATVQDWLGPVPEAVTALDPRHPVTIGPYMNDPDLINNKYQLERAMDAALAVLPEVVAEYEALSGRRYDPVDLYRMDDAEVAVFLLNSAAETAKDVADRLRERGRPRRRRQPQRDPAVPRGHDPRGAARCEGRRARRALRLLRRPRRQPLARGEVRAEGRPGEPHALPEPRLRPRRARLLRRGRRGVLPARAGGRRARRGGSAVRLLRRGAGRSRETAAAPRRAAAHPRGADERAAQGGAGPERPARGRRAAVLAAGREAEARAPRPRRLPRLRRLPGARPVPARHRGRRRRALPDGLRDGRHHRLPVHVAPHHATCTTCSRTAPPR